MKFQMIIAACLVFGAQLASAVAPSGGSDCAKNASITGTGVLAPSKVVEKIDTTEKIADLKKPNTTPATVQ